jgi:hypothetical protein
MSCLFDSLAVYTPYDPYRLRQLLCDELCKDPLLSNGIRASEYVKYEMDTTLDEYIHTMRDRSAWGGALEVDVFTRMFARCVRIHVHSTGKPIEFGEGAATGATINLLWTDSHFSVVPSNHPMRTGVALPPPPLQSETRDRPPSHSGRPRPQARVWCASPPLV